jgi:hypothetical protein
VSPDGLASPLGLASPDGLASPLGAALVELPGVPAADGDVPPLGPHAAKTSIATIAMLRKRGRLMGIAAPPA